MKRVAVVLVATFALLVALCAAGGVARAASTAAGRIGPIEPGAMAAPTPGSRAYLPLVFRDSGVGGWSTIVEEGFETTPGGLWAFWSFGGSYNWAARSCRPYSGASSAWAVGGGVSGNTLACSSNCPSNVDSWMAYGPFSLENATAANLSFEHWIKVGTAQDDGLWICASSDGAQYNCRQVTYQPDGWGLVTFPLDNGLVGFDMLGQPEVWIALDYVNVGTTLVPEGAYVDDFVIRECTAGSCQSAARITAPPADIPLGAVKTVKIEPGRRVPTK